MRELDPLSLSFRTTRWSLVLRAGGDSDRGARDALSDLCAAYWYPLYAFVRRRGHTAEDASDLTQEFFTRVIEKRSITLADPGRGRFRTFLLTALERFLVDEWHRGRRLKRGGGRPVFALDRVTAEGRYASEPSHLDTPEVVFERRWALSVLARTFARLERECIAAGRGALFDHARGALAGERGAGAYRDIALALGMSESAVKTAIHRLRRRYGMLLRAEVAETVGTLEDVDAEIACLYEALGAPRGQRYGASHASSP